MAYFAIWGHVYLCVSVGVNSFEKKDCAWAADGEAERVRSYNFPEDRVTDHRIGKKFHNIEKILNGDLDPIVKSF